MPNESPVMTSYLKLIVNYMPIRYRFQDIGSFNNLLIKLINLINMAGSTQIQQASVVGHTWVTDQSNKQEE